MSVPTKNEQINAWLTNMESQMMKTIEKNMLLCLDFYQEKVEKTQEATRTEWMLMYNSQCIVTMTQMNWTLEIENAITIADKNPNPMKALKN